MYLAGGNIFLTGLDDNKIKVRIKMGAAENLKPQKVFRYFEQICSIPHGSGNVDKLSDYLVDFAKERKLSYIQDELKNVIIIKEASLGYEGEEPVILQGHMDMVAVKKPGAEIDMEKEGLRLRIEDDYLYAEDTSLGGDDGIAVAYALAILDDDEIAHPRLEVILTVDEEVGMDGARELDVSMLKGRRMLNLDSEEEGIILAGCAGGARVDWKLPVKWEYRNGSLFNIKIKGLKGGHSGAEINKERGNANCLLGRLLEQLRTLDGFCLAKLSGGLADNAIPREAEAAVLIEGKTEESFLKTVRETEKEIRNELRVKDAGFSIEVSRLKETDCDCLSSDCMEGIINLLYCAPNGIQAMSAEIEGLAETSLNLGIIELDKENFTAQFSVRSSLESAKRALIIKLKKIAGMAGADQTVRGDYPGWEYRPDSPFRETAVKVYERMFGKEPKIEAIHAGLECGLLASKIENLECISIGPDMKDIHTTEERLSISSAERVWNYVLELLRTKAE